jgi:hypothetical protein
MVAASNRLKLAKNDFCRSMASSTQGKIPRPAINSQRARIGIETLATTREILRYAIPWNYCSLTFERKWMGRRIVRFAHPRCCATRLVGIIPAGLGDIFVAKPKPWRCFVPIQRRIHARRAKDESKNHKRCKKTLHGTPLRNRNPSNSLADLPDSLK